MRVLIKSTFFFCKRYKIPYNINRQEHKKYFDQLRKAQNIIDQTQNPTKKKRIRLYDRPRIDRDINGYGAWRVFSYQQFLYKSFQHSLKVDTKVWLQPKWLIHGFGLGGHPVMNPKGASRQYNFLDNKFSQFLLYDYRQTTNYKPNIENYDYQNQQHLRVKQRLKKRLSPKQFWQSQDYFGFRLNSSNYAEYHKFRAWIESQCQRRKSQKSYDQKIQQKFGKPLLYNNKQDLKRFQASQPMILHVTPQHFQTKNNEKLKKPEIQLGKIIDQKHRATQEDLKQVRTIRVRKQTM